MNLKLVLVVRSNARNNAGCTFEREYRDCYMFEAIRDIETISEIESTHDIESLTITNLS